MPIPFEIMKFLDMHIFDICIPNIFSHANCLLELEITQRKCVLDLNS